MIIGAQGFTLRDYTKDEAGIAASLKKLHDIGYRALQVSAFGPIAPERLRELATLKVLGFYDRELSAYIYRENVILTVFGVAMGMVMGKLLHQWLILTVEIDMLMFGRQLSLSSYAYAVVLTVLFSLLVNLAAHRKLKKLDMVESLKTVE